ncbi:DedA family protein [Brachybacterium sp. P6-10-X1]|uniref:DedA family protein n=1 Tax=Brachybacterium sp. P6-10-X1 TaxID=1903186 RepID=UPI0009F90809|nr:DedA family protein [Brachybacterium sp. P6-10-X1]
MGGSIDWLLSLTGQIEGWIMGVADAWWIYLVVYAFAAFDGFFPTVPSESTIVTLSSLWSSSGRPLILLIGFAAWMGAWTGDNLGYWLGSKIGWERFRFLREGKGRRAVEAADRGLQRRALLFLMTARYIPFGRTAVNLVAGAVHYPHKEFWPRSLLSTFVWAVYSCAIGAVAGAWFGEHHLLAITVALIAAVVLALIVERLIAVMHRVLDRRAERRGEIVEDRLGITDTAEEPAAERDEAHPGGQEQDGEQLEDRGRTGQDGHHELADPRDDQDIDSDQGATPLASQGQDSPA